MALHNLRPITSATRVALLALGALALLGSNAAAQYTVDLVAAPLTKAVTLPNGGVVNVPMWGFARGLGGSCGEAAPTVPGPRITVPDTETQLTINLRNCLPEAASIVIPGQQAATAAPVRRGDGRIVSMAPEAATGGGTASYTWNNLKPGSYLYHSGSHAAVQVQMGLYGALTRDAGAGEAYPDPDLDTPGSPYAYANEVLLLYSEIDVALHNAVNDGTYGTAPAPTSTIDYAPSLFLVNGSSYTGNSAPIAAGPAGQRKLIRMLNAGLQSHVVVVDNASLSLIAEDGNAYADAKAQASILLPAGKTHDATWMPTAAGEYGVYDRALRLVANEHGSAGMLAKLTVAASGDALIVANPDAFATAEDSAPPAFASVLDNDTGAATAALYTPPLGSLTLNPDGTFTYTPPPNFSGFDSFLYRAVNGSDSSAPAQVTITVTPVQDAPTAFPLNIGLDLGEAKPITLTGLDPDGDPLTFKVTSLPGDGTLSIVDPNPPHVRIDLTLGNIATTTIPGGTLTYTANGTQGAKTFEFQADDGGINPLVAAQVAITVHPPETTAAAAGTPLFLSVVGSDGAPVEAYRWTLEEDLNYVVIPGDTTAPESLAPQSVRFHKSSMLVVASGVVSVPGPTELTVDSSKRYFVSVLPTGTDYTNGGTQVAAGQTAVTVFVNKMPIPTGQIRVFAFVDNASLNGVYNNVEPPLSGVAVKLEDTGGVAHGHFASHQITDAFGNPLGTTYRPCTVPAEAGGCPSYEIDQMGDGFVLTDKEGYATFKNLSPGLYEVFVQPPSGSNFIQGIQTFEGGKPLEAWVKANEPPYFYEFGPPGPHVNIGFVQPTLDTTFLGHATYCGGGCSTITGQITNLHMSRPPAFSFFSGAPFDFTRPYVALQVGGGEYGQVVYLQPTDEDGNFTIAGVPPGVYKLWLFDSAANFIPGPKRVVVAAATDTTPVPEVTPLGQVPIFQWFARLYMYAFDDANQNGFRDPGEAGIPEVATDIRHRDGSLFQYYPTDVNGFVPYEQIFPFYQWHVAEVGYTQFKATGATVVVDEGGKTAEDINGPPAFPNWPDLVGAEVDSRVLNPQLQSDNGGQPYRTETGPVLLEGFQGNLGQSSVILWGKTAYAEPVPAGDPPTVPVDVNVLPFDDFPGPGDTDIPIPGVEPPAGCASPTPGGNCKFDVDMYHGGMAGIVHYSSTRAENLARWGVPEDWEPGIARVRVQLWNATRTQLLNEVTTDSWDDNPPTGCQWPGNVPFNYLGQDTDCFDGLRNFNQVRAGVFDGGFAFYTQKTALVNNVETFDVPMDQRTIERPLPAGKYVVKVIVPPGYTLVKEEDKNVDFGEEYIPAEFLIPGYPLGDGGPSEAAGRPRQDNDNVATPFCVGALHTVPDELSLYPGVPGTYALDEIPLCDEKLVTLRYGQNAAPNFFLFTEAPTAGHAVGFIMDDTSAEFDPNAPQFGERYAPPWMPVSVRDWTGREVARTYSDRNGVYNVLVPTTFTAAIPAPSGYSPNILQVCINPSMKPGPGGTLVPDEWHNKSYSQWCYPFDYMPGKVTYMDTPVVPTGAFAGQPGMTTVDAELPNFTPVIYSVNGPGGIGPYVVPDAGSPASRTITLTSAGMVVVPNPEFDVITTTIPKNITRDYGFGGTTGEVLLSDGTGTVSLPILGIWGNDTITVEVPVGTPTGQLSVVRCQGGPCSIAANRRESVGGVTLTVAPVGSPEPTTVAAGGSIQAAIEAASAGDLILVRPGTYNELLVMDKPVRLQGWGARSTVINAAKIPVEKLQSWRDKVKALLVASQPVPPELVDPPPGFDPNQFNLDVSGKDMGSYMLAFQADEYLAMVFKLMYPGTIDGAPDPGIEEPKFGDALGDLPLELLGVLLGGEGAGVTVLGKYLPVDHDSNPATPPVGCPVDARSDGGYGRQLDENGQPRPNARVDGFTISGSDGAAAIEVNGNACDFQITNNHIVNNNGYDAAGLKVGHIGVLASWADEQTNNDRVEISRNFVSQNGSILAHPGRDYLGGGGITIGTGTHGYKVTRNYVTGNYTGGYGAGIAHIGLSTGGTIDRNTVVFNESYNQLVSRSGGGIYVGGRGAAAGEGVPNPVGNPFIVNAYPANLPGPTPGSGHVTISNNLVHGNQAAAGDGGGISLSNVNGRDIDPAAVPFVVGNPPVEVDDPLMVYVWNSTNAIINEGSAPWEVNLFGNTITNNVAGLAGGGLAVRDAAHVQVFHNTIAHNDSVAVAGEAFQPGPQHPDPFESTSQPAGIVSYAHSTALVLLLAGVGDPQTYSSPEIVNSIVWNNRSFYFGPCGGTSVTPCAAVPRDPTAPSYSLIPRTPPIWDLGVLGGGALAPTYSVLTDTTGTDPTNTNTAPAFVTAYFNTNRRHAFAFSEVKTGIDTPPPFTAPTFDEGGNFIRPLFGPLTLTADEATGALVGDYHLTTGVNGQLLGAGGLYGSDAAVPLSLTADRDGDPRLGAGITPHRGFDQVPGFVPASITISDATVTEGNAGLVAFDFTVSLSRAMTTTVAVMYSTKNGSARASQDYVGKSGILVFAPGTTQQTVRVMVIGDRVYEADERFFVKLTLPKPLKSPGKKKPKPPVTVTIGHAQGVGVIVNDDPR